MKKIMSSIKFFVKAVWYRLSLLKLPVRYFYSHKCFPKHLDLNVEQAEKVLSEIHPDAGHSCLCENEINPVYDLHIIVPVYNTAQYVVECLDSILYQDTKYSFFISITNDGSTDDSKNILETYISSLQGSPLQHKLAVTTQSNMGLSAARNTALNNIVGRYVMFVDSDDRLMPGAIESLMSAALSNNADIAEGNFTSGSCYGFACGKVYDAELFRNIHFPPGYWFEDTINALFLYHICRKRITIKGMHYYYRPNESSIMNTFKGTSRSIDSLWVSRRVLSDYFSSGHKVTEPLFRNFLQDAISTASHIHALRQEDAMLAVFVIQCSIAHKFFGSMLSDIGKIKSLSLDLMYMTLALKEQDYRRFRSII